LEASIKASMTSCAKWTQLPAWQAQAA